MEILIAALLAGGFITLTAHLWRKSQAAKEGGTPPLLAAAAQERTLDQLELGDVLVYDGRDLIVAEVWLFERETVDWREYRLDEEGQTRWLIADRRDSDAVRLGSPFSLPREQAPSEVVDHGGEVYQLEASGEADTVADGSPRGEVGCWDYARAGSQRLWIRRGGTLSIACAGERVRRHLIDVLPGS